MSVVIFTALCFVAVLAWRFRHLPAARRERAMWAEAIRNVHVPAPRPVHYSGRERELQPAAIENGLRFDEAQRIAQRADASRVDYLGPATRFEAYEGRDGSEFRKELQSRFASEPAE